jgi:hypothetical protein
MLHTKMEGNRTREILRTGWIDEIIKDIEMREGNLEGNTRKQEVGE